MTKINLLNSRKAELLEKTADVRKKLSEIIDDGSFVELNTFSFAKSEFYGEDESGLGVLTGYATVDGFPVYVVAQNPSVCFGGLSKANCDKICECLQKALSAEVPVLYLLSSQGVQVGEGVAVLESAAKMLRYSNELKDVAPQFAIATGNVFGHTALLFDNCDYSIAVDGACVSFASPAVVNATGKASDNGATNFAVKTLGDAKDKIVKIFNVLPKYAGILVENDIDLNNTAPALANKVDAKGLISASFDKDSFIELNANFEPSVITGIGRVGGYSVGAIVFDGGEDGVELDMFKLKKVSNFANYLYDNDMPVICYVNVKGITADAKTASTPVTMQLMDTLYNLTSLKRVNVVYGKAIGVGYTAFCSKAFGSDYTYALVDAKISLLDGDAGVMATFGTIDPAKVDELKEKYVESQDCFNAAKLGCVDNVIDPEFVRQYLISALQMII